MPVIDRVSQPSTDGILRSAHTRTNDRVRVNCVARDTITSHSSENNSCLRSLGLVLCCPFFVIGYIAKAIYQCFANCFRSFSHAGDSFLRGYDQRNSPVVNDEAGIAYLHRLLEAHASRLDSQDQLKSDIELCDSGAMFLVAKLAVVDAIKDVPASPQSRLPKLNFDPLPKFLLREREALCDLRRDYHQLNLIERQVAIAMVWDDDRSVNELPENIKKVVVGITRINTDVIQGNRNFTLCLQSVFQRYLEAHP